MPALTVSRHQTSEGEVTYVRQPDGTTQVVLGGRELATARPPLAPPRAPSPRARLGFRLVELGLHLLADRRVAT